MKILGGVAAIGCALLVAGCSHTGTVSDESSDVSEPAASSPLPSVYTPPGATIPPPVPTTVAPVEKVRLKAKGQGIKTTKTFVVEQDEWTIGYSYNCGDDTGNFQVYVYKGDGTIAQVAANALDVKGDDVTYQHGAGRYYLMVNTTCAWNVRVVG